MISRGFIQRIHQGAYIHRWNDHVRPDQGFYELDKQAHKLVIAFFLAKIEEHVYNTPIDYQKLIEGGLSQYFHRVELTDIKPPIFHRLMEKKGKELNEYVIKRWVHDLSVIGDRSFFNRFQEHLEEDLHQETLSLEHRILSAAHYLATKWEFDLIYSTNQCLYGIEKTKNEVENKLENFRDLSSIIHIKEEKHRGYANLLNLIGQLRFQRRWTQLVRLPETSVMGHSLIVAILTYVISLERGLSSEEAIHHFWLGLFHDIPEVLTRDIISPVKQGVSELETIIKEIEKEEIETSLASLFPKEDVDQKIREDFLWYIQTEFENKPAPRSEKKLSGSMIKHCDLYAAYVEASLSLSHGIFTPQLEDARSHIEEKLDNVEYDGFRWRLLLDYFA